MTAYRSLCSPWPEWVHFMNPHGPTLWTATPRISAPLSLPGRPLPCGCGGRPQHASFLHPATPRLGFNQAVSARTAMKAPGAGLPSDMFKIRAKAYAATLPRGTLAWGWCARGQNAYLSARRRCSSTHRAVLPAHIRSASRRGGPSKRICFVPPECMCAGAGVHYVLGAGVCYVLDEAFTIE